MNPNGCVPIKFDRGRMNPETVHEVLVSVPNPEIREKAAGIVWWDTCESRPSCAQEAVPFRPVRPQGPVDERWLYRVLRKLGYAIRCARFRCQPVKFYPGCIFDANRIQNPNCSRTKSRTYQG